MHISIVAYGTWGDVRPALALGEAMKAAGYGVRLIVTQDFAKWIRDSVLDIRLLPINKTKLTRRVTVETNPLRVVLAVHARLYPALRQAAGDLQELVAGTDALLVNEWMIGAASGIAQANGLRLVHMALQPNIRTSAMPISTMPELPAWAPSQGIYNLLTYEAGLRLRWWSYGRAGNRLRTTRLDVPPLSAGDYVDLFERTPSVTMISPHVVPRPSDWADHHRMTGFLFYDDARWAPPVELMNFIQAGPPPVYVGFGSLHDPRPADTTRLIVDALQISGQRAVLLSGWGGLGRIELPESVYRLSYAPHGWLFPRMAAVVHHGGAGTSAAALRAGVPSIPVPHSGDQGFWGHRLRNLGAATDPLPRSRLNAESLAERITAAVATLRLRTRAAEIGSLIRKEDGLGVTVSALEDLLHHTGGG